MTDRIELQRLILQIERGRAAQTSLRVLLAAGAVAIAGHRQDLRDLKARIKRRQGRSR